MSLPSSPARRGVSIWTGGDDFDRARAVLDGFSGAVRRSGVALFAWAGLCLMVAAVYARSTTPEYLASVQLVLRGGHKADDGPDASGLSHELELSGAAIETQLALIRSPGFLQPLFETLHLDGAPELATASAGAGRSAGPSATSREDSFEAFRGRVGARRIGVSTAFEVSYRAPDPAQAVRVANAIAVAYAQDRIRTAMVDTRAFTPYLQTRIAAIMIEAALAAEAVRRGGLPEAEFVDADVRLLGPARMPLAPAYPRLGPIAAFAIGFGLISGLLVVAVIHRADKTIRSRAQLRDAFGIEAFSVALEKGVPASQAALVILAGAVRGRSGVQPPGDGEGARLHAIGLLSWADSVAPRAIGAGVAEVMRLAGIPARLVDPAEGAPGSSPGPVAQQLAAALDRPPGVPEEIAIVVLPAAATSFAAHAVLPLLNAVVLVVLAGRTTHAELRRALRVTAVGVPVAAVVLVEPQPAGRRPGTDGPRPWVSGLTVGAAQNNTFKL